jgi:hypothetical protein
MQLIEYYEATPSAVECRTIPERGSIGRSPTPSVMSLDFSSGRSTPVAPNPVLSFPALSLQGIIQAQNSTFTGQSPASIYQTLLTHLPASNTPVPSPYHGQQDSGLVSQGYHYRQADEERLQKELSTAEALSGAVHTQPLEVMAELARVLASQGRYKSAEKMIRRVVEGHLNATRSNSISTLEAFDLLGYVLMCQGLHQQAQKVFQWTDESKEAVFGREHSSTLSTMVFLVNAHTNQERWKEAEVLRVQASSIIARILGEEHPNTLFCRRNLAYIFIHNRQLGEAEELTVQLLEAARRTLNNENSITLNYIGTLPTVYLFQSR